MCNQDCNQGRDCPERARKVKAYPAVPEDQPPFEYVPTWRDYLPDLSRAVLAVFVVIIASAVVVGLLA